MRILHILDHSIPLHSGYAFRTRAIVAEQRCLGWETSHLTSSKHYGAKAEEEEVDGLHFYRTLPSGNLCERLPVVNQYEVVRALERRLADGSVREVILATNAGVEGEATAAYLARRLQRPELRLSRPAQGLPAGGELEFTDRLTLARALRGRRDLDQ